MKLRRKLLLSLFAFLFFLSISAPPSEAADEDWQQTTYYVNAFNDYVKLWSTAGSEPWIGDSGAYIYGSSYHIGWFDFADMEYGRYPANMTLQLQAKTDMVGDVDLIAYYRFDSSNTTSASVTWSSLSTNYRWYNWTFINFNSSTEFDNFRILITSRNHGETLTVLRARAVVWHSKATYYTFHGLLNENTGSYEGPVTVTALVSGADDEVFVVDGTTVRGFVDRPDAFIFHLTDTLTRQFHPHTDGRDDEADIYIYNSTGLAYYDVTFYDIESVLRQYPYATTERKINGVWQTIEQIRLDNITTTDYKNTKFLLSYGRFYRFAIRNTLVQVVGDIQASYDSTISILLPPTQPSEEAIWRYKNVVVDASRSANGTSITINYVDSYAQTISTHIYIRFMNYTVVHEISDLNETVFTYTWVGADNETDYLVDVSVNHRRFGYMNWPYSFAGVYAGQYFDLGILGLSTHVNMAILAPTFLLLAVAGSFSSLNTHYGIIATALVFALFCGIGWYDFGVATGPIIVAMLSLAFLAAVAFAKKQAGVIRF